MSQWGRFSCDIFSFALNNIIYYKKMSHEKRPHCDTFSIISFVHHFQFRLVLEFQYLQPFHHH